MLLHFRRPVDREMLRALRPSLATTGGRLIILSSPYGQSGALWELHRKHHGNDDSKTLVWQATASEMNPTLPTDYLGRMQEEDPEAYRSEVLGEFRAGIASFIGEGAYFRFARGDCRGLWWERQHEKTGGEDRLKSPRVTRPSPPTAADARGGGGRC